MRTFAIPPRPSSSRSGGAGLPGIAAAAGLGLIALTVLVAEGVPDRAGTAAGDDLLEQVLRGRALVMTHACGGCHGGFENPASERWLAGQPWDTLAFRGFRAWPRNLTPDVETGMGAFSERQIFNALRYGLRPRSTPDVEITSAVPGEGNHPAEPDYLSPAMPWPVWRYMSDEELRDVAAYLKHGLRPVSRVVQESEAPPDLWAAEVAVERIGTHVLPPFPTQQEELGDPDRRDEVLLGRRLVASRCGICHGGGHPGREGWMAGGEVDASEAHPVCAFCDQFRILGFWTRPRNLTPHNTTGMGRFTERQIFNALRYGLRPGETADVDVTSTVPGEGNHPPHPKYLAPPMPWPEWRHMPDEELRAIAAYMKHGLKPVARRVQDSEGPADFWVGNYTGGPLGTYPAPAFPTARERWPAVRAGGVQCLTKTTLSERVRFADIDRAHEILGRSDEWARQLSAFDRGVRQRTLEPTNTRGFLEFVAGEAAAWTHDEEVYWRSLVDQLSEAMEGLNLDIPAAFMVKTTGLEEFNAVYVRNQSIMLPQGRVAVAGDVLRDFFLLAHELFHMLSLEYPARRDELYALLGFRRFAGFEYPAELEDRRLSNPVYGARYEYALTVQTASGPVDVTPAYQAAVPLEEFIAVSAGGLRAIFEAIDFVLLPVDTGTRAVLRDGSGYPIIYQFGDTDWTERMQRNSSYVIHPDELLAENFALLMEWRRSGTVPESVPGGPGEGFPVTDIDLLEDIQKVLTAGCGE